jgi:hypothetical protein
VGGINIILNLPREILLKVSKWLYAGTKTFKKTFSSEKSMKPTHPLCLQGSEVDYDWTIFDPFLILTCCPSQRW